MRKPQHPPNSLEIPRGPNLKKFFRDEVYLDLIRECESKYWPWDIVRMIAPRRAVDPKLIWSVVRVSRATRYRKLDLIGIGKRPLQFNVPDFVQQELMLIDQQLAGQLSTKDESALPEDQRERFIISSLQEEAIASSMLEGAATTRREAKDMLKSGKTPRTPGEIMVVNNYHAIQFIRQNRKTDLSPEFLKELHIILTTRTLDRPEDVGRLRIDKDDIKIVDVRDNEIMHVPPHASELPDRLERLCRFANEENSEGDFIHPVIRACILHFQLGFDHPFCDGNGRTARALFYWLMLRKDYGLFEYLPISRLICRGPSKYQRAFLYCETDDFDVTYFLMYKAKIISRARKELKEYITTKLQERLQARRLFSSDRRLNHRQREIVLGAVKHPHRIFTIASHQSEHAVAYATARNDLLKLVEWGYLRQEIVGKRLEFLSVAGLAKEGNVQL